MKKLFLSALLLFAIVTVAVAQNISVADFYLDEHDLTALQSSTKVIDRNGEPCALIKIETKEVGFTFDVGILGVMKTVNKTGEIWVYVPYGIKRITLNHTVFDKMTYSIPINIEKGRTYKMKLIAKKPKIAKAANTLIIHYSPVDAMVLVDDNPIQGKNGVATAELSLGEHKYHVVAYGYESNTGQATITKEKPTNVGVTLIPNSSPNPFVKEDTLKSNTGTELVPEDRRIVINDIHKAINELNFDDINLAHTKSAIYDVKIKDKLYFYATIPNHPNLAIIVAKEGAYKKLEEVILPETFQTNDGRTIYIVGIGEGVFYKCKKIKKVVLPKSIRYIGNSAFKLCDVKEVLFSEGIVGIGDSAFEGNLILDIKLPEGIKEIGDLAFSAYDPTFFTLKIKHTSRAKNGKLYLPKSLEKIGEHAFGMSRNNIGTWWNSKREILCLPNFIDLNNCKDYGISKEPVEEYLSK